MRASLASLTLSICFGVGLVLIAGDGVAQVAKIASYKIVSEDGSEGRRSISIRLPGRVSEVEIKRMADDLIAKRRATSGRVVVRFFLDGMALDQAPWATATYQSDLKIAISGLKLEEEELYLSELRHDRRQIVGAWLTSPPAVPGRLAIYREKGKVFAEWRLRNGLKTVDELEESRVNRGRRYDVKGENAGHFMVTAAGVLEMRDADRLIAVAERIAPEKLAPSPHGNGPVAQSATPLPQAAGFAASLPAASPAGSAAMPGPSRGTAVAEDAERASNAAPITTAAPKPQARKRVARPLPVRPAPVKSAARDAGPIMRLPGQ